MKTTLLLTLSLMFLLHSCGQKQAKPVTSSYGNKVVLAAFNDMTSSSTFNEEALAELPRIVNFSSEMTSVKNQGHRGTCTFFAATALIEAALKMDKGIDVNLSEEYLMYSTKAQGDYSDVEASHVSVNLQSIKEGGILLEKDLSYRPSWFSPGRPCAGLQEESDITPIGCFIHAPSPEAISKIIPANSIKTGFIRKNTNEVIKYLANNKRPLSISLPVNFKGWDDNGNVIYNEELRQECLLNSKNCGAHSVVLTGYNLDEKVFYFKNSWGNDWGEQGFGRLSFELVDKFVDGYVYYAKVDGEISIPEDAGIDNFKLENLEVSPVLTDSIINLGLNIKASEGHGQFIEVQNFLGFTVVLEDGSFSRAFPLYNAQYNFITITANSLNLDLSGQNNLLTFPENTFQIGNVQEAFLSPLYQTTIITSVVRYTDTSVDPVQLTTVITPIKK